MTRDMSDDEHHAALNAARFGYGPLAHTPQKEREQMVPPFGGEMQPGLFKGARDRKFANPAPLGLSACATTLFVMSMVNLGTRGLSDPAIIISLAFGYGGLLQFVAGMWEMAIGNTFGATALSSYGGFWISFAILLTPGGFAIEETLKKTDGARGMLEHIGLFLIAWFIFTFLLLLCTLKSTVAFFLLFFLLDLSLLFLGIAYLLNDGEKPHVGLQRAGGATGIVTSFTAWYNAYVGIANDRNTFILIPDMYFPWTELGRKQIAAKKNKPVN